MTISHKKMTKDSPRSFIDRLAVLLVIGLAAASPALAAEVGPRVDFHEKAELMDGTLRLGDIAAVSGNRAETVDMLQQVIVGTAPLPGENKQISADSVILRLKKNGVDISDMRIGGSGHIDIIRLFQEADVDEIENAIRVFIEQKLGSGTGSAEISSISLPGGVKLPRGRLTIEAMLPDNIRWKRKMPIYVNLSVDGAVEKKLTAIVELKIVDEVVIARRTLNRGRLVTEQDVTLKTMDVSDLPANLITDIADVVGQRTKKGVDALEVLRADMVEYPPLVKKGDIVQVIAESDTLKISTVGMIQGVGGRPGDRVKVTNIASNKDIYARVIDAKTVQVDYFKN